MCGRYTLTTEQEALQVALAVEGLVHTPRFNIAPTQEAPVVFTEEGRRVARNHRWGLIPPWADDPAIGNRMINARSETVGTKRSFRNAFRKSRCLIPADGFYEWRAEPGGKAPYWIHLESRAPFTFAGLREVWEGPERIASFTILTADALPSIREIHHRMPVILDGEAASQWLDPEAKPEALEALLGPGAPEPLTIRRVSRRVNSPRNDDPGCLEEVPADPSPLDLFGREGSGGAG